MQVYHVMSYQASSCTEISSKFLPHQYILLLLQLSAVSICVRSPVKSHGKR